MKTIDLFEAYGKTFIFEPPVIVGESTVSSLGKLTALAAAGHDANPVIVDAIALQIDKALDASYELTGTTMMPEFLSDAASRDKAYMVTLG